MANRIYINVIGTQITLVSPCTEDIQVQASSEFTRLGEFVPNIDSLLSLASTSGNQIQGGVSNSIINLKNSLDVPVWKGTSPVKVSCSLNFFIKTDSRKDVWEPTMLLQSMSILSSGGSTGKVITPGFNIQSSGKSASISSYTSSATTGLDYDLLQIQLNKGNTKIPEADSFKTTSKFCSLFIPGIVYIPVCIVETCQPTWSKQLTANGYPLWSKVDVQFTGSGPAIFEDNFASIDPDLNILRSKGL